MSSTLPQIKLPTKKIELPESKKTVSIRSYTVGEEKIMKMALEDGSPEAIRGAIVQIIGNALVTPIDFESLPLVDIEYIFMQMYSMSRGSHIHLGYKCLNKNAEGVECGAHIDFTLDINDYEYKPSTGKDEEVFRVTDDISIQLKKPTAKMFFDGFKYVFSKRTDAEFDLFWDTLLDSTVAIINGDEVITIGKEMPRDKLTEFYNGVPSTVIEKMERFLDGVSSLSQEGTIRCGGCGHESKRTFTGVEDFFV